MVTTVNSKVKPQQIIGSLWTFHSTAHCSTEGLLAFYTCQRSKYRQLKTLAKSVASFDYPTFSPQNLFLLTACVCLCVARGRVDNAVCCCHNFWLLSCTKASAAVESRNRIPASHSVEFGRFSNKPSAFILTVDHIRRSGQAVTAADCQQVKYCLTGTIVEWRTKARKRHGFCKLQSSLKMHRNLSFYFCWVCRRHGASFGIMLRTNCGCRRATKNATRLSTMQYSGDSSCVNLNILIFGLSNSPTFIPQFFLFVTASDESGWSHVTCTSV
jgi:hypothetical protein